MRRLITGASLPRPPGSALPRRLFRPASFASTSAFIGLALSSSHAAGVIERFGIDGTRSAVRELAMPYRADDEHVLFGYLFQCFTARREASLRY